MDTFEIIVAAVAAALVAGGAWWCWLGLPRARAGRK